MKMKFIALLLIILMQFLFLPVPTIYAATTRVGLGTTDNFAVLAGSAVNDTTPSVIVGDVGLSPTTGAAIGITAAEVTGTIYAVNGAGPSGSVNNPGLLTIAKNDLTTAYNDAAGRSALPDIGTELAGATLTDGVYHAASGTFEIAAAGTLTLNGQGNADSVFIFKMGTTLVTGAASHVVLTNGAQACNVFWQVGSSATLGTTTSFIGNIMADQSITDNGGSTVNGRLLASVAAVTLNNTHVTKSTCAAGTAGGPSLAVANTSAGVNYPACPALNNQVVAPAIITSKRVSPTSIFISWGPYSGVNTFNVQYGPADGNWLYNTDVTGFSTTINDLPTNTPFWFRVAARSNCRIGTYGASLLVGEALGTGNPLIPLLPNTGIGPDNDNISLKIIGGIFSGFVVVYLTQRLYKSIMK